VCNKIRELNNDKERPAVKLHRGWSQLARQMPVAIFMYSCQHKVKTVAYFKRALNFFRIFLFKLKLYYFILLKKLVLTYSPIKSVNIFERTRRDFKVDQFVSDYLICARRKRRKEAVESPIKLAAAAHPRAHDNS
jgi:hypothetical protein